MRLVQKLLLRKTPPEPPHCLAPRIPSASLPSRPALYLAGILASSIDSLELALLMPGLWSHGMRSGTGPPLGMGSGMWMHARHQISFAVVFTAFLTSCGTAFSFDAPCPANLDQRPLYRFTFCVETLIEMRYVFEEAH